MRSICLLSAAIVFVLRPMILLVATCSIAPTGSRAFAQEAAADPTPKTSVEIASPAADAERKREARRLFQTQQLITAEPNTWVFNSGKTPRIVWRDVETIRRLGGDTELRIRWFDGNLNEFPAPNQPGRWMAWVEATAPNGTPFRRSFTFYGLPKKIDLTYVPDLTVALPHFPGLKAPAAVQEHQAEIIRRAKDMFVGTITDSENGAVSLAGLAEFEPLGRPARFVESAVVLNGDYHLALKLKLLNLQTRELQPARRLDTPAITLRDGSLAEAGMRKDAKIKIDDICRKWAEDTGEPFVTLVARHGVIVTHEAFGSDPSGAPVSRDYRCWVASITKTVTAILFSQFLDQGLIDLDDPLSAVFPDYPLEDPHVPTFRQCFNHTSGLSGHGEFGGMQNAQLENIVLNAIDVIEPNTKVQYCGLGYELAAKAMELVAGKSAVRIYDEHLFRPLGFGDVPIGNASSDGEFTAMELGILAQWIANGGSYGQLNFIAPETFQRLLPKPLTVADRGFIKDAGIGLHWKRHTKAAAPRDSKESSDLLFSPRTLGHGSFSGCILMVDLQQQLIVAQVRKQSGPRNVQWQARFFQTVAAAVAGTKATVADESDNGK